MAATQNIMYANCALNDLNQLILAEAGLEGASDSDADVVSLRAAQKLVTDYIASTAAEVGSPEDLEDIAEDQMNNLIRNAAGYWS